MSLGKFFKNQKQGPEHFWSLVIGKTWVQAAIWRVVGENTEVIAYGNTVSWQDGHDESLIEAADGSLSAAAASIDNEASEPNKVVFGLSPAWIQEGTIRQERLGILKKLSGELELTPAGFVVIPEAISHYVKSREGAPLNAILVGLAEDSVDVTLVQNGRNLGTVEVAQSISLGSDVAEGMARLPSLAHYPSRIILYDHKVGNLEDARQNLLDTNWEQAKISFLHTPKVEILPEDAAVTAVSLAGGAEVGNAKRIVLPEEEEKFTAKEDFQNQQVEEAVIPDGGQAEEVAANNLGFVHGEDVAQQDLPAKVSQDQNITPVTPDYALDTAPVGKKAARFMPSFGVLGLFAGIKFPNFGLRGAGVAGITAVGFLLCLAGGGLLYWYLPKAEVTVYVAPKKLEKTLKVRVDPKLSVINQAEKIIPGAAKESVVLGDKTTSTTGTKTVGERAKGQVIIYHIGGATVIKSGAFLAGPGGLKFALDNDINVASSSGITSPSRTQASVVAADIGSQYNLAAGSKLSVGNFSRDSFEAQNENAFSGGTSRSVSAVGEEDLARLEKDLTGELLGKGLASTKNLLSSGEVLIEDSAVLAVGTKDFSHKVGEEATTLKLSLQGKVVATVVPRDAVNALVMADLEKDVPAGYTLKEDQVDVSYKVERESPKEKKKDGKKQTGTSQTDVPTSKNFALNVEIVANLLPKVDLEKTARSVTGKYPSVAREYLATIPGYVKADISFSIQLPGKLGTLPRIAKNITVKVVSEK